MTTYNRDDVKDTLNELDGWIDGFVHGAQLSECPIAIRKAKCALEQYYETLIKGVVVI